MGVKVKVKVSTGTGIVRDHREIAGVVSYLVGFKNSKYLSGECRIWYRADKCKLMPNVWQKILSWGSRTINSWRNK